MATPEKPGSPAPGPAALHAPWRQSYLESIEERPSGTGNSSFLHDYWQHPERDEANHVVVRTGEGMILLNLYPYSGGHLLVALGEPRCSLLDYSAEQRAALWRLTDLAAEIMQLAVNPQGINIGINQGRAAGAGVPNHLHVHLVPRWSGDVNFINIVGGVRVISASLEIMARRYRAAWDQVRARTQA